MTVFEFINKNYLILKRIIDICVSSTLLVCLLPVFIISAIAVKLTSPGPILFWSKRRGLDGKVFNMPKFRTMTVESKVMSRESATENDYTFTPIGKFLRKFSIDEIPQLCLVFFGSMSLIGPRPLIIKDRAEEARFNNAVIYRVRPGITGLAQVNGRNLLTPKNKTRYDAFYATKLCMILDAKIILKTLSILFDTRLVK